jgi:Holliday junction resolvasome RuvABC endonuclease subunit
MTTVLGIDPSLTCTGLAIVTNGLLTDSGVIHGGDRRGAERLAHIYDGVTEWLQRLPDLDDSVVVEGYAFGSKFQREAMGEVGGVVRLCVYRHGRSYSEIAPSSWQTQLLGRPVEKKLRGVQLMQRYADVANGTTFDTYDALEAFAIAFAGWQRAEGLYAPPPKKKPRRKTGGLDTTELLTNSA